MESIISSYMYKYYYVNREIIWTILIVVALIVFAGTKIGLSFRRKDKIKKQKQKKEGKGIFLSAMKELFQYLCVILCGHLFFYLDLFQDKNTEYVCFMGISAEILLILFFLVSFFSKRPRSRSIQLAFQWTKYLCYTVVFLAKTQGSLDNKELCFGLFLSVLCGIFSKYLISEKKMERNIPTETDYSISTKEQLFPKRKEQLETFIAEWEKQVETVNGNPYVVLLNAPWGYGKTSFLNAFCNEIENTRSQQFELVYLETGVDCDSSKLLEDFEKQLRDIFKKNAVHGNTDSIKKYVKNLSELVNGTDIGLIEKFGTLLFDKDDNSLLTDRENANKSMDAFHHHTKKNIVIIIDDIERSSKNRKNGIFNVLYECMHLNYCHTIFIADKSKMIDGDTSMDYFDKYINEEVNLCDVDFKEIFESYQTDLLGNIQTENSAEYKWLNESKAWFEKNAVQYTYNRLYTFEYRIKEIRKKIQEEIIRLNSAASEDGLMGTNKAVIAETITALKEEEQLLLNYNRMFGKNLQNPRYVKKYMRDGIRKSLYRTSENWFEKEEASDNSYSNLDWLNIANSVLVIKFFLPSLYQEIRKYSSLAQFEIYDGKIYKILELLMKDIFEKKNEKSLFEILIYHEYVLDPKLDKSEEDLLLDDLKKANENPLILQYRHLERYLDLSAVAMNPDVYLIPILDCIIECKYINNSFMIRTANMIMHYDVTEERENLWSKFRKILSYYATKESNESVNYTNLLSNVADGIETIMEEALEQNREYLKVLFWEEYAVQIFRKMDELYSRGITGLYERLAEEVIDVSIEEPEKTVEKALLVADVIDNSIESIKKKYAKKENGTFLIENLCYSLSAFSRIIKFWYSPLNHLDGISKDLVNEEQEIHVVMGNDAILESLLEDSEGNNLARKEKAANNLFQFCSALLGYEQAGNINRHTITMITKIYENLQETENLKKPDYFDLIPLYMDMFNDKLEEEENQATPDI